MGCCWNVLFTLCKGKKDIAVLETILENILLSPGMGGVSWDKISVDEMACKEQNYNEKTDCCCFFHLQNCPSTLLSQN